MKKSAHGVILCVAALLMPVVVSAADFDLDKAIGHQRNNSAESWMDTKEHSPANQQLREFDQTSSIASSYGNVISIQTAPGSHVVLNANQINKGNQNAEVSLRGMNFKKYKNVELPRYDTDYYVEHIQ